MGTEVDLTREIKQLVVSSGGTIIENGVTKTREDQVMQFHAALGKAGATSGVGYINTGTDTGMVTLAASATADTWIVPVSGIKEGDIITGIGILGQIESAANAVTVDYALRAQTAVATGSTDAAIQAGTQVAKSADYLMNESTAVAAAETVAAGKSYYFLVTITTAASTDVELLALKLEYTEK